MAKSPELRRRAVRLSPPACVTSFAIVQCTMGSMEVKPQRSSVALFVALTRAVREAPVSEDARLRAYEAVEGMARALGQPRFKVELEAFATSTAREPRFFAVLQPFWPELRALSAWSAEGEAARILGQPRAKRSVS